MAYDPVLLIMAEAERRLSVVGELQTVVGVNLQRATRLRLSILQRAFSGELTAKTGANTEPKPGLEGEIYV